MSLIVYQTCCFSVLLVISGHRILNRGPFCPNIWPNDLICKMADRNTMFPTLLDQVTSIPVHMRLGHFRLGDPTLPRSQNTRMTGKTLRKRQLMYSISTIVWPLICNLQSLASADKKTRLNSNETVKTFGLIVYLLLYQQHMYNTIRVRNRNLT